MEFIFNVSRELLESLVYFLKQFCLFFFFFEKVRNNYIVSKIDIRGKVIISPVSISKNQISTRNY